MKQNLILESLDATRAKIATKPTPGPWEIGRSYSSTHATAIRWKGENLAWVCGIDSAHEFSPEQTAANARLIAAAPELLDACEMLCRELVDAVNYAQSVDPDGRHNAGIWHTALAECKAVIAKITR